MDDLVSINIEKVPTRSFERVNFRACRCRIQIIEALINSGQLLLDTQSHPARITTHVYNSIPLHPPVNKLCMFTQPVLDINLIFLISGEGKIESRQYAGLQIGLQLLLIQKIATPMWITKK